MDNQIDQIFSGMWSIITNHPVFTNQYLVACYEYTSNLFVKFMPLVNQVVDTSRSLIIKGYHIAHWTFNYLKIGFHDWVDQSGVTENNGVKCIYYTYRGHRYMVPVGNQRGPAKLCSELEDFYRNDHDTLVALRGPNNDWHGHADFLIKAHKLN